MHTRKASVLILAFAALLATGCSNMFNSFLSHTITYHKNGGLESEAVQKISPNEAVTLNKNTFTRSGFSFLGWALSSSASKADYCDEATYVAGISNLDLYAIWAPESVCHTVTFKANGGTGEDKTQSLVEGKASYLRATGFTRSGYDLLGWAAKSDAASADYADGAEYTMGKADVTFYAIWRQKAHAITFKVNNGDDKGKGKAATRSVPESGSIALPSGAEFGWTGMEGAVFGGWALSLSARTPDYAAGASFAMGKDDVTLYAIWGYKGLEKISSLDGVDNHGNKKTISVSDGLFELGSHYAGTSTTLEIPIKNTGDLPLTISSITLTQTEGYSAFSLSGLPSLPYVIPNSNQWPTIKLTFACVSEDQYKPTAKEVKAALKIKTDDPDEAVGGYVLNLSGYLGSP